MHLDQRTQAALRAFGLETEEIAEISASVVELSLGPTVGDRVRFAAVREEL